MTNYGLIKLGLTVLFIVIWVVLQALFLPLPPLWSFIVSVFIGAGCYFLAGYLTDRLQMHRSR